MPPCLIIRRRRPALLGLFLLSLGGCTALGAGGPRTATVLNAGGQSAAGTQIRIVEVTDTVARAAIAATRATLFSTVLGDGVPVGGALGRGDVVAITIWEAPPAALFATADMRTASYTMGGALGSRGTSLPEQMIDGAGRITVPFVGAIAAAGRSPAEVEHEIVTRLRGMAHQPQVMVQQVRNASATVTVVGDVATAARVPLTPRGERLLDVLAAAGGVRQAVGKTTIQVSRGGRVAVLPLETVIRDPAQNIRLQSEDVVTALSQPWSFTALGATGTNAEINFEGTGITLAQALGRIGGLRDDRANPHGVFIFRLEEDAVAGGGAATPEGKVPVIYRVDLNNPASFFVAQGFPIRNHDIVYVSNAPLVDLQKFVGMVSQLAITGLSIGSTIP